MTSYRVEVYGEKKISDAATNGRRNCLASGAHAPPCLRERRQNDLRECRAGRVLWTRRIRGRLTSGFRIPLQSSLKKDGWACERRNGCRLPGRSTLVRQTLSHRLAHRRGQLA